MAPTSKVRRRFTAIASATLARYIEFVHRSARLQADPEDFAQLLKANHPLILAVWHGQFLMIPKINVDQLPTRIVVAHHSDAEVIGRAFARFHVELIRGAGAGLRKKDRGGAGALRAALKALKSGNSLCMTADVPPGPARRAGEGMITLARLSGRPVLPAAMATRHYLALRTWSRMTINLPFSRLGLALGEPITVPRNASDDELEALRLELEQALNSVTRRAYDLAGGNPRRATPPRALANLEADGRALPIGWRLRTYQRLTSALRPLAPSILKYRERRNKEDPARRQERFGMASRSRPDGPVIWVHAASVGEFNAVLPLIKVLTDKRPDLNFLVTTGTMTSARLARNRLAPNAIHQFVPLDAAQYVDRFLTHWQPDLAIFTESEVWPNLVLVSAERNIPLVLINGRMSDRSFEQWRRRPDISAPLFGRFALVLAQSEKLARRFSDLGAPDVRPVGNLKVDAPLLPVDPAAFNGLHAMIGDRPVFIAASTHDGEEDMIGQVHERLKRQVDGILTILAPRHPGRADAIEQILQARGLKLARRSCGTPLAADVDIYLADTIGEMGLFYRLADVAFMGGSFVPHGGQNPIEAIRQNACVLTGPHWHNFREEYKALIKGDAVREVRSVADLANAVIELFGDGNKLALRQRNGERVLQTLSGALARSVAAIEPLLPATPGRQKGEEDLRRVS